MELAVIELDLLTYGFREGKIIEHFDRHDKKYWLTVKDHIGKKFPIEVRWWNLRKYSRVDAPVEDGWDAVAYFTLSETKDFRVELSVRDVTPKQIVDWFEDVWKKMGCQYNQEWES